MSRLTKPAARVDETVRLFAKETPAPEVHGSSADAPADAPSASPGEDSADAAPEHVDGDDANRAEMAAFLDGLDADDGAQADEDDTPEAQAAEDEAPAEVPAPSEPSEREATLQAERDLLEERVRYFEEEREAQWRYEAETLLEEFDSVTSQRDWMASELKRLGHPGIDPLSVEHDRLKQEHARLSRAPDTVKAEMAKEREKALTEAKAKVTQERAVAKLKVELGAVQKQHPHLKDAKVLEPLLYAYLQESKPGTKSAPASLTAFVDAYLQRTAAAAAKAQKRVNATAPRVPTKAGGALPAGRPDREPTRGDLKAYLATLGM